MWSNSCLYILTLCDWHCRSRSDGCREVRLGGSRERSVTQILFLFCYQLHVIWATDSFLISVFYSAAQLDHYEGCHSGECCHLQQVHTECWAGHTVYKSPEGIRSTTLNSVYCKQSPVLGRIMSYAYSWTFILHQKLFMCLIWLSPTLLFTQIDFISQFRIRIEEFFWS